MMFGLTLVGSVATGPLWSPPESPAPTDALIIVYRYSQIGANSGSWVPTRLEMNERAIRKLPDDTFVVLDVPAGDITLSATDMRNFRYADVNGMSIGVRP